MVTVQEKIKLMNDLGLSSAARALMRSEEILAMTALKFHPITLRDIQRKIIKPWHLLLCKYVGISSALFGITGAVLFHFYEKAPWLPSVLVGGAMAGFVGAMFGVMFWLITGHNKDASVYMATMPLDQWEHNMPYGALLALKEAKDAGLGNFEIFYPTRSQWNARFNPGEDPVITARTKNGVRVEVFSWDDGKVYE